MISEQVLETKILSECNWTVTFNNKNGESVSLRYYNPNIQSLFSKFRDMGIHFDVIHDVKFKIIYDTYKIIDIHPVSLLPFPSKYKNDDLKNRLSNILSYHWKHSKMLDWNNSTFTYFDDYRMKTIGDTYNSHCVAIYKGKHRVNRCGYFTSEKDNSYRLVCDDFDNIDAIFNSFEEFQLKENTNTVKKLNSIISRKLYIKNKKETVLHVINQFLNWYNEKKLIKLWKTL